jgi:hypothetical protein
VVSASRGLKPKNAVSNMSTSARILPALTKPGIFITDASTPAAISSSSEKMEIDSTPFARLSQNCSRLCAPGNRPAIPMMAMPSARGVVSVLMVMFL